MRYQLITAGIFLASMFSGPAQAERVTVKEGIVRLTPSPLGAIKNKIPYDTEVRIDRKEDAWVYITQPESGWMHASSLTAAQSSTLMAPGKASRGGSVSGNEVSLAGKGFDKNIEAAYRKTHETLRYDLVDRVERLTVSDEEVRKFLDAGERRGQ